MKPTKSIEFSYVDSCLLSQQDIAKKCAQLEIERKRIKDALMQEYATDYASFYLPSDEALLKKVSDVITKKKALQPTVLVVLGIGGSNLGTLAVHQAIKGVLANEEPGALKVYYADTIGPDYTTALLEIIERELIVGNSVLLNVVSKSGTTTETVINFELFLQVLKKYHPEYYRDYIVITTDKESKLWEFGQEHGITCLEIPRLVGGRYSVFSAVGLFPLGMLGVNIALLCQGARDMRDQCLEDSHSVAAISAAIMALHYRDGHNIHDFFVFPAELAGIGQWYRQLVAESLGKQHDRNGNDVFLGPTPTVSIGSTDLHSVGQLYLGGPHDKYTTIVSVDFNDVRLQLAESPLIAKLMPDLQGKTVGFVLEAIVHGLQKAFATSQRPFTSVILPEKNAYYCGQLLQWKMLEIVYMGALLQINPFDQPQVELYKSETRKILAHE